MTIYSLYIFDRHCDCVYYQDWHRTRPVRPSASANFKPGVHRLPNATTTTQARESIFTDGRDSQRNSAQAKPASTTGGTGLPFDEEAKLVYGVILSLRNMVKKLSGRDEAFTSYKTPSYKLHYYETLTGYRFILLSDPSSDSLRFVLRQLYTGPFVENVVRNPLINMDDRTRGIDSDLSSCGSTHQKPVDVCLNGRLLQDPSEYVKTQSYGL